MSNCPIMARMKEQYENRSKTFLTRRLPIIMRLDGKAFHTFTKGLVKPFDEGLIEDMQSTAIYLCQNIQGAKCAYTQSDEISILITDYDDVNTQAWFDNNVQKMVSISASLATAKFNQVRLDRLFGNGIKGMKESDEIYLNDFHLSIPILEWNNFKLANFDSRVFTIPKDEVNNYFIARQRDAVKNSIAMLAQSLYSHKELHGKDGNQMQELCFQKGYNWNDLHYSKKRGSLIIKQTYLNTEEKGFIHEDFISGFTVIEGTRNKWEVIETPTFSQDKIIESLI